MQQSNWKCESMNGNLWEVEDTLCSSGHFRGMFFQMYPQLDGFYGENGIWNSSSCDFLLNRHKPRQHVYGNPRWNYVLLNFIATDWTAGVRFPVGTRDLSLLYSFNKTGSATHAASYLMGTGDNGGRGVNLNTYLNLFVQLKNLMELHLLFPTHFRGVVLN
jgi:hypothetical protein